MNKQAVQYQKFIRGGENICSSGVEYSENLDSLKQCNRKYVMICFVRTQSVLLAKIKYYTLFQISEMADCRRTTRSWPSTGFPWTIISHSSRRLLIYSSRGTE